MMETRLRTWRWKGTTQKAEYQWRNSRNGGGMWTTSFD